MRCFRVFTFLALLALVFPPAAFTFPPAAPSADPAEAAVQAFLDALPESQRIAQIFLVNIEGNTSYAAVEHAAELCAGSGSAGDEPLVPGGCLLFSYNIAPDADGVMAFTESIAAYCDAHHVLRPYIAVDQEGGMVNRLRGLTSPLPSCRRVAEKLRPSEAGELYALQARQLRALGVCMNIAPVAEAALPQNDAFLGSRSYGGIAATVAYSCAAVRAYQDCGVGTVLKHFPGNTNTDPHTGLPEIKLGVRELLAQQLFPFACILGADPAAVLMSHARTEACGGPAPACLSSFWIQTVLKDSLGCRALVLSDDIFMGALADNGFPPEAAAVQAVQAGVDVIMLSEKKFAPVARMLLERAASDADFARRLAEAERNVIRYKLACGILALHRQADGLYVVEAQDTDVQFGSRAARREAFSAAKAAGTAFVQQHFAE